MNRQAPTALIFRSDAWLWLAVAMLVPLGLVMVTSASLSAGEQVHLTPAGVRQAAYALCGLGTMLLAARVDYRLLQRFGAAIYVLSVGFLAAVIALGVVEHGARRWLAISGVTIQPGEFAKLGLAVGLAAYGATRPPRLATVTTSAALLALPALLVLGQPDLGTVIVLAGIWLVFIVCWGTPWRLLAGVGAAGLACGPLAFAVAVPHYQRERLAVFFDPNRDPLGSGFNLRQVEVALGTGGVTGHGLFTGAQAHLDAVSARASDFMFGFLGAELGLIGGLLLIALLALVVTRGIAVAVHAPDTFGRLLGVALTSIIGVQGLVNVAVNLRLFPVTGIPLPFISQGGSSLIVMLTAIGLLQSIAAHHAAAVAAERWRSP